MYSKFGNGAIVTINEHKCYMKLSANESLELFDFDDKKFTFANLREKLKTFFSGLERSSGSEDFLEELFIKGDYEAVFTYESSIITINQKLEKNGKETLYALYPVDGVSISDSPIGFIDQKHQCDHQHNHQNRSNHGHQLGLGRADHDCIGNPRNRRILLVQTSGNIQYKILQRIAHTDR